MPHLLLRTLIGIGTLLLTGTLSAQVMKSSVKMPDALARTLTYFFEAERQGNVEILSKAYHPQATLFYLDTEGETVIQHHVGSFFSNLVAAEPPKLNRTYQVLTVDIAEDVAQVLTEIRYPDRGRRMIDLLTIMRSEGEWHILSRASLREYASFEPIWNREKTRRMRLQAVREAVMAYADSRAAGNLESMVEGFHPGAAVAYVDPKHQLGHYLPMPSFLAMVEEESRPYQRRSDILSVEIRGPLAQVKLATHFKGYKGHTVDFLTLMEVDGQWTIVHKATHKTRKGMLLPI